MILIVMFLGAVGVVGLIQGIRQGLEEIKNQKSPPIKEGVIDDKIENEIALLEIIIERRKETAYILENQLQHATDKRKVAILTRLNTLDKQTYKDLEKLNKLKE